MNLEIYRKRFAEESAQPDTGRSLSPEEIEALTLAGEITPVAAIPPAGNRRRVCYPPCVGKGRYGSRR